MTFWFGRKNGYSCPDNKRSGTVKVNQQVSVQYGSSLVGGWNSSSGWPMAADASPRPAIVRSPSMPYPDTHSTWAPATVGRDVV